MISKKEKLLQKAYDAYIDLMLRDFPLDRIEELVVSDVTGFGTTLDEKILDLNRLKKVVTDQREQGTGMDIRFVTSPLHRRIDPEENFAIYVDEIEITMLIDGDKNIIPLRLSSVFEFINNSWKLVHLHGSKAVESEGDTWHKEEWKKQNEKLQKQVEKKTADLAKKNWELEIETSLQRVRTVAMSMRKPEDLAEMSAIIFEELKALGLKNLRNSEIIINKDDQDSILSYYYSDYGITGKIELEYKSNPIIQKWANDLKKAGDAFAKVEISPKEIDDWRKYRESIGYLPDPKLDKAKSVYYYSYSTGLGALSISSFKVISKEAVKLLERFRNVFALAYRRYADVAKAEKQAREAQIELALERVRASTMAMQKSEELGDVAILLFKELNQLVDNLWTCGFVLCEKDRDEDEWWLSTEDGFIPAFYLPNVGDKTHENIYNAWKRGETYHTEQVEGDDLTEHYEWLMNNPVSRKIFEDLEAAGMERPDWQKLHCAFFSSGYLVMITRVPCPEEAIFKRFAQVFNQTYTRFLDLQKAEEQAREAQIEAALERVRSQAMAIRKSDELIEVIQIIFQEMEKLGFDIMECSIVIYDINPKDFIYWTSSSGDSALPSSYKLQYINHPVMSDLIKDLESGVQYRSGKFSGEILKTWWDRVFTESDFKNSPIEYIESWKKVKQLFYSQAAMSHGFLEFLGSTPLPEDKVEVLKRFTKVVDLAYTRHDDVVNAEAQAREAQIEAALEKVRSRSLAMHTTNELGEVVVTLVEKLKDLGVVLDANGVVLCTYFQDSKDVMHWMASPDFSIAGSYLLPYFDHPIFNDAWQSKESGTEYFSKAYSVDEKNSFFEYAFEYSDYKHFPDDFKKWIFQNDQHILSFAWQKNSAILIPSHTGMLPSEEDVEILKRFAKVFEQSYVRFLDLKKAEVQARKAQLELSLERIRAQVTSMQKSSDLLDIVVTMRTEFVSLGHEAHYFWYMRYHPETYEKAMTSGDGTKIGMVMTLPRHIHGDIKLIDDWEKSDEPTVVFAMDVETAVDYIQKMITLGDFKQVDPNAPTLDDIRHIGGLTFIMARTTHGEIGFSLPGTVPDPPQEDLDTLVRFAGVFDLAYRRFEDLKLAEQQNRETQIELALERVRAKTMAMHNSHDMGITVETLFEQVLKLGLDNDIRCGIGILEGIERMETRSATLDSNGEVDLKMGMLDMTIHPLLKRIKNGWEKGETHYVDQMTGKDVIRYYTALNNEPDYPFQIDLSTLPKIEYHNSFSFPEGIIFAFSPNPMSEEAAKVLGRFARVFGQTYRRFVDLQKAEEQAREAQIEAALERVRSKAMAMHSSEDLGLTVDTFFAELEGLNVSPHRCGLGIIDKETKIVNVQAIDTNGGKNIKKVVGDLKLSGHPVLDKIYENWELQKEYFPVLRGDEILDYYKVMNPQVKFHEFADDEVQYGYYFYFKEGGVYAWTDSELPERDLQIFRRYSSVLSLTYRRYLDLKEAEGQAREAKIEASLERIRGRALGMQQSSEVGIVNDILFEEFEKMGIEMVGCGISVINEETDQCEQWRASQVAAVNSFEPFSYKESMNILSKFVPVFLGKFQRAWKEGHPFLKRHVKGKERDAYIEAVATMFKYNNNQRKEILASFPKSFMVNFIFYKRGWLSLSTLKHLTEYEINFSRRFVEAFDFAHTRFLDLQRAEAQAKEATKQASLDRVRGEIASMRSTEDLQRITPLIWRELKTLEVPFSRCGVFIIDESLSKIRIYLTTPDGNPLGVLNLPTNANDMTRATYEHWQKKTVYQKHWNKDDFMAWMQSMIDLGQVQNKDEYQGHEAPPESLDLHFIPFSQGLLYVGNKETLTEEKIDLVKSLAKAFSIAYARYEDFVQLENAKNKIEITFNDLKSTQNQLVHAEKMASLGELTAGIAHEIQNPLNFVNNFSEVNKELIEELLEELDNGDLEEVKAIASDIAGNEEKIKHHGKRADGIVKGMLQHSRSSTGNKEPTDINELADEYLRLAYHGLRAKDKSFNADFKTELDKKISKVNVIPQDIGRVLLNLINNAFHACTEQSRSLENKTSKDSYKPIVIVSTKKLQDSIEIKVKDNGSGIPDNIKEKIFQPFFTTKATGEGTGLGLSLSYDIVTKGHGGKLDVETNEGEDLPAGKTGTTFIIQLPIA